MFFTVFLLFFLFVRCVRCLRGRALQTVALDHYGDQVDSMMDKFVAINSGVEKTVRTDFMIAAPKTSGFLYRTFHFIAAARHKKGCYCKKSIHIISCAQRSSDRRRRGVEGHRISVDTTGSWFQKPAISLQKSWGGYRRTTLRPQGKN